MAGRAVGGHRAYPELSRDCKHCYA
eukprot:SAG22_NODE_20932_length_261_cov_0.950617_2_plen_24_part_01